MNSEYTPSDILPTKRHSSLVLSDGVLRDFETGEVVYGSPHSKLGGYAVIHAHSDENTQHLNQLQQFRQLMRRRLAAEASGRPLSAAHHPELQQEIRQARCDAAESLRGMRLQSRNFLRAGIRTQDSPDASYLAGLIAEMTFFTLPNVHMTGDHTDTEIVIPSSRREDMLGFDEEGRNLAYDFKVIKRIGATALYADSSKESADDTSSTDAEEYVNLGTPTKVQVKLSNKLADRKRRYYAPDILVVSMEHIAGSMGKYHRLQEALIQEILPVKRHKKHRDPELIDEAATRLREMIDDHTHQQPYA